MSRIAFFFVICMLVAQGVCAQDTRQILIRNVGVPEPLTIAGDRPQSAPVRVRLWGVSPLTDTDHIAGMLALEEGINNSPVNCTIKQWSSPDFAYAQCIGFGEKDMALSLIEKGYAMADRTVIGGTIFDSIYRNAETAARKGRLGLWHKVMPPDSARDFYAAQQDPFQVTQDMATIVIAAMILGPFIGMLIVGGIIYGGFQRLLHLQRYQIAMANKKDRTMREREKFIVAASLEGELNTNRAKLDAFIIIYEELLRNLRDPLKDHKYKKAGDIIHEKPALSRNVYDSNIDKLDLLGQTVVTELTALYTQIEPNPNYRTIEPDTPIDEVIDFVAAIVRDAEAMLTPIDRICSSLNVIVRDKRAKASEELI